MAQRRSNGGKKTASSSSEKEKFAGSKNSEKRKGGTEVGLNNSSNEAGASAETKPLVKTVLDDRDPVGFRNKLSSNNSHSTASKVNFMEMLFNVEENKQHVNRNNCSENQTFNSVMKPPLSFIQELFPEPECKELFEMTISIEKIKEEPLHCSDDFDKVNLSVQDFPRKQFTEALLMAGQIKKEAPNDDVCPPDMLCRDGKSSRCLEENEISVIWDKSDSCSPGSKKVPDPTGVLSAKLPVVKSNIKKSKKNSCDVQSKTETPSEGFLSKNSHNAECSKVSELKKSGSCEETQRSNRNNSILCTSSHNSSPMNLVSATECNDADVTVCYMDVKIKGQPWSDHKDNGSQATGKMICQCSTSQSIPSTESNVFSGTDDSDCVILPSLNVKIKEEPLTDSENYDRSDHTPSKESTLISEAKSDSCEDGSLFVTSASKEYGKARRVVTDIINLSNGQTGNKVVTDMHPPSKNLSCVRSALSASKTSENTNLSNSAGNDISGSLVMENLHEQIQRTTSSSSVNLKSIHKENVVKPDDKLFDKISVSSEQQICDESSKWITNYIKFSGKLSEGEKNVEHCESSRVLDTRVQSSKCVSNQKSSSIQSLCCEKESTVSSGQDVNVSDVCVNSSASVSVQDDLGVPCSQSSHIASSNSQNTGINHTSDLNDADLVKSAVHTNVKPESMSEGSLSMAASEFKEISSSQTLPKSGQTDYLCTTTETTEIFTREKQHAVATSCGDTSFALLSTKSNDSSAHISEFSDKQNSFSTEEHRKQKGSNFFRRITTVRDGKMANAECRDKLKCGVNNSDVDNSRAVVEVSLCDEINGGIRNKIQNKRFVEMSSPQESKKLRKSTFEDCFSEQSKECEISHKGNVLEKVQMSSPAKNEDVSAANKFGIPPKKMCLAVPKTNAEQSIQQEKSFEKGQFLSSVETDCTSQKTSQLKHQNNLVERTAYKGLPPPQPGSNAVLLTKAKPCDSNKAKPMKKNKRKKSDAKDLNVEVTSSVMQNMHLSNETNKTEMLMHNGHVRKKSGNLDQYHYFAPGFRYSYGTRNVGSHFNNQKSFMEERAKWNCQSAGKYGHTIPCSPQFQQMTEASANVHNHSQVGQTVFQTNNHVTWSNVCPPTSDQGCFNVPLQPMNNLQNSNIHNKPLLPPPNLNQSPLLPPRNVNQSLLLPPPNMNQSPLLPPPNMNQSPLLPPPNMNQSPLLPPPNMNQSPLLPPPNMNQSPLMPPLNTVQTPVLAASLWNYPHRTHNFSVHHPHNMPFMTEQHNPVSSHSTPLTSYPLLQHEAQQYPLFPDTCVTPTVGTPCYVSQPSLLNGCVPPLENSVTMNTVPSDLSRSSPELELIPQPPPLPQDPPPLPPSPPPIPPCSPSSYSSRANLAVTLSNSPASSPLPPLEPLYGTSDLMSAITTTAELASLSGMKQLCSQILASSSELHVSCCASVNLNISACKTHPISVQHSGNSVDNSLRGHAPKANPASSLDDFLLRILLWNVKWLEEQIYMSNPPPVSKKAKRVELIYVSYKDYYDTYFPLLLLEAWDTIFLSWKQEKLKYICKVKHYRSCEKFFETQCDTIISSTTLAAGKYPVEGHLIIMCFGLQKNDDRSDIFGYVSSHSVSPFVIESDPLNPCLKYLQRQHGEDLYVLSVTIRTAHKSDENVDFSALRRIEVVHYLKTILKQHEALLNLHVSPLCTAILCPSRKVCKALCLSKMHSYVGKSLCTTTGANQIAALIVDPFIFPQVIVIKALPGTDKINTLVKLIHSLKSAETNKRKTKVLLCAKMNEAIDRIGCHLAFSQQAGENKPLQCIRLGDLSDIHPKMRSFSLYNLLIEEVTRIKSKELDPIDSECEEAAMKYAEMQRIQQKLLVLQPKWSELLKKQVSVKHEALLAKQRERESILSRHKLHHRLYVTRAQSRIIKIIEASDVILSTVGNCHQSEVDKIYGPNSTVKLDCCIIDDASQCSELETLIPLLYGVRKIILIGDPNITPKVLSQVAAQNGYNLSYYQRVFNQVPIS